MPRASIDYMNARRALMPAAGGANYADNNSQRDQDRRRVDQCAADRELDPWDRLDAQCDSAWSDCRIRAEVMWQQIFERFGYLPDDHIAGHVDEIPF